MISQTKISGKRTSGSKYILMNRIWNLDHSLKHKNNDDIWIEMKTRIDRKKVFFFPRRLSDLIDPCSQVYLALWFALLLSILQPDLVSIDTLLLSCLGCLGFSSWATIPAVWVSTFGLLISSALALKQERRPRTTSNIKGHFQGSCHCLRLCPGTEM